MSDHIEIESAHGPRLSAEKPPARPVGPGRAPASASKQTRLVIGLVCAVLVVGVGLWAINSQSAAAKKRAAEARKALPPVPVVPGTVEQKDVPIYLDGLGTVQAFNTVTVRSRVDGQVQRIAFVEGQDVRTGVLLAQIDPAPFQTQLDQNIAKKAQDEAQLTVARLTLSRDKELLTSKILAQQDYDTQQALVDQLVATVNADQAAIDNARVQLGYTTITSPLEGRTGIRLVDQGNIVHATDANGIVVITQLRPISVVFTLPEQDLARIREHLLEGETLSTLAVDRDNRTPLGEGKLAVLDNQIDSSTGTIRLKATFSNDDFKLWPGQFVNARLLLETRKGGTVVPASVIQRGNEGTTFAFVISNGVAVVRPVKVARIDQDQALIDGGLAPGEVVVVDGQYKLQPGARVSLPGAAEPGPSRPSSSPPGARKSL